MYFSTTGSSSRNKSRSCGSGTVPPSYLCLSVSVNISVDTGDIQVPARRVISRRAYRGALLRFLVGRRPAEQHFYAVVDELLPAGSQPAVQVGGEQGGQAADQTGGHHLLPHRGAGLGALALQRVDEVRHPFRT